jgi:hypothetical protein
MEIIGVRQTWADDKTYVITGAIEKITGDTISVRNEKGIMEFKKEEDLAVPKDAKVGDQISIWYTVDMEKIAIRKGPKVEKQEPGEVDMIEKNIIIDDRAFYTAKNAKKSKSGKQEES